MPVGHFGQGIRAIPLVTSYYNGYCRRFILYKILLLTFTVDCFGNPPQKAEEYGIINTKRHKQKQNRLFINKYRPKTLQHVFYKQAPTYFLDTTPFYNKVCWILSTVEPFKMALQLYIWQPTFECIECCNKTKGLLYKFSMKTNQLLLLLAQERLRILVL